MAKYMLTSQIYHALLDENIEALSYFSEIMLQDRNYQIMTDKSIHMRYDVIKLDRWKDDLIEFKYQDFNDEVRQLVVTLKHVLGTYIGYSYTDEDGVLHDNKELAHFYRERITDDVQFNYDFDLAYLKLRTLDFHMIKLYHYLDKNRNDKHGIETVNNQIEEERLDYLRRAKVYFSNPEKPIDPDIIRTLALVLGYDDGVGLIHKIYEPSYSREDLLGIIESRLDIRNDVKKGKG